MIDNYKIEQPLAYNFLINAIKNNRISHAYLFDVSNLNDKKKYAIAFAKYLICHNHYSNDENCCNCNICKRIDNDNFPEIKIIEPDGLWIKKEQILGLQNEFSTKAIESKYKVCIILNCEQLNKYAANSLLKFLEEPEENIITILLTNNIGQVLKTIVSRCQVITFQKEMEFNLTHDEEYKQKVNNIIKFIKTLEMKKLETFLVTKNTWYDSFKSKEDNIMAFDLLLHFYRDVLNYVTGKKLKYFIDYISDIEDIAKVNDIMKLTKKIRFLVELQNKIDVNVNNELLIDKLIINMAEV